MIWQEEMKRDAARLAFPDWELRDDDRIELSTEWEEGYSYSEHTFEHQHFSIHVGIRSADNRNWSSREYENEHAHDFFVRLMRRASAANISVLDTMTRIAKREALHDAEVKRAVTDAEIRNAKGVYEKAMYYASINEQTRQTVHDLVQQRGGIPMGLRGWTI